MARRKSSELAIKQPQSLEAESKQIVNDIIPEKDPDKIKNFVDLFNLNQSKKNMARVDKYNQLMDKIVDELVSRADQGYMATLSEEELCEYLNSINGAMSKASINTESLTIPTIQTNTQVNVNVFELNRDSRERVADAVKAILEKASSEKNYIDISNDSEE